MKYLIFAIIALAGVALGMYIARRNGLVSEQTAKKTENKQKILGFVQEHEQIKNDDVEKLAGVSNATAERYLSELEKEEKLIQHGTIGQGVFYTLK